MPPSYNVIEIDADAVRIIMRQRGQGTRGEEPLAHFARRPLTTSEFHPPLERFVRYAKETLYSGDRARSPGDDRLRWACRAVVPSWRRCGRRAGVRAW